MGVILLRYNINNGSNTIFKISGIKENTTSSQYGGKNFTFNGSVTSNTGFVTNEGNLKRLSC